MNDLNEKWLQCQKVLSDNLTTSAYQTWFAPITPLSFQNNVLVLQVKSQFIVEYIEENYLPLLSSAIRRVFGKQTCLEYRVLIDSTTGAGPTIPSSADANTPKAKNIIRKQEPQEAFDTQLNESYTFENFIVGDSNRFAQAACWKVAKNPSREWNPLFIYGPSGVGKTHLLYAVINEISRQRPAAKIIYTKGDDFTNYMIDCITHKDMSAFRERYRGCDVLLVDDIQFISGKVATQEEFFHTFQALFDEGKQIILASDRPPHEINPLEERLRSRFEQGLLADINPPNIELRVAIIKKKAEDYGIDLPGDVLSYLSENLRSNIRQIEGAIKKLVAKSMVDGRQISMELAKDCLADLLGDAEPLSVTIDKIFAAVFKKYGISREDIVGKKRTKEIARARHIAIYLVREITEMSYPNIGKLFGRDHATVMSSLEVVKKRIAGDPLFDNDIDTMKREIAGR